VETAGRESHDFQWRYWSNETPCDSSNGDRVQGFCWHILYAWTRDH
jgi:hypothetical protein